MKLRSLLAAIVPSPSPGITNSRVVTADDYGKYLRVTGQASNIVGPTANAFSDPTAQIGGSAPVNTVAPTLSGTPQVGKTLTVDKGTWTGYPAPTFTYQWMLCDAPSCGDGGWKTLNEDGASLKLTADMVGAKILVVVTGTNDIDSDSASTNQLGPITKPVNPAKKTQSPKGQMVIQGRGFQSIAKVMWKAPATTAFKAFQKSRNYRVG